MVRNSLLSALIGGAALLLLLALPAAAKGYNGSSGGSTSMSCNDGTVSVTPVQLSPPDHRMHSITLTYSEDASDSADGDTLSLTVNSVSDNQSAADDAGASGCGQPTADQGSDWTFSSTPVTATDPGPATAVVQLRAERCGSLGSRDYDINVTCADTVEATSQTLDLHVIVPHDQRSAH